MCIRDRFRLEYFPVLLKSVQVIMDLKAAKNPQERFPHRPTSLWAVISKLFEKLLVKGLTPKIVKNNIILDLQSGFVKHSTVDQIDRIKNVSW